MFIPSLRGKKRRAKRTTTSDGSGVRAACKASGMGMNMVAMAAGWTQRQRRRRGTAHGFFSSKLFASLFLFHHLSNIRNQIQLCCVVHVQTCRFLSCWHTLPGSSFHLPLTSVDAHRYLFIYTAFQMSLNVHAHFLPPSFPSIPFLIRLSYIFTSGQHLRHLPIHIPHLGRNFIQRLAGQCTTVHVHTCTLASSPPPPKTLVKRVTQRKIISRIYTHIYIRFAALHASTPPNTHWTPVPYNSNLP
ncbi:hypothetical protein QBC44DRAFT_88866 [Cladorrhinum sp. PSN332]|nr:hypothetical protein QBC44DRAFT_88866 [Cladorrhinum sp. PSN332]